MNNNNAIELFMSCHVTSFRSGKFLVTWTASDGSPGGSDEYDTVLGAIGRGADTAKLGLESAGVKTDKKGKIPCVCDQVR